MKIDSKWVIWFKKKNVYLVDVPPTGFKSVRNHEKATRFESIEDVRAYAGSRGVFVYQPVLIHFDVKQTPMERALAMMPKKLNVKPEPTYKPNPYLQDL
ncbi:MAG TPA: hypothetical protein VIJ87_21660 [Pyrinomonadaceae bacterium]